MIDPKELRIGNLIYNQSVVVAADGRTIFDLAYFEKPQYQPIPITPEWLKRFAFERRKDHYPYDDVLKNTWFEKKFMTSYTSCHTSIDINEYSFTCWVSTGEDGGGALNKIYFVHQLQNLYFALTGTELTLIK